MLTSLKNLVCNYEAGSTSHFETKSYVRLYCFVIRVSIKRSSPLCLNEFEIIVIDSAEAPVDLTDTLNYPQSAESHDYDNTFYRHDRSFL